MAKSKNNWLNKKYSKSIKINGSKKEAQEFIRKINEFAPIAEKIISQGIYK